MNVTSTTCSMNSTLACHHGELLELADIVILCTLLGVASVIGTLGNSLVLLSIIKSEHLRTVPDLFIFSLSASDLLVTALFQPMKAYRLSNLEFSSTLVAFLIASRFVGHVSLIASISNMFAVTVERLISIRVPLKYPLLVTTRRALVTIFGTWFFSLIFGALVSTRIVSPVPLNVYFVLVLSGTISVYVYIFAVTRKLENAVIQVQVDPNRGDSGRERKSAKTIFIILGVALVCWLPFLLVSPFLSVDADPGLFYKVFFSLQALSVCNSSINPYIYCVRSRRYSVSFMKLLNLSRRRSKRSVPVAPARSLSPTNQKPKPKNS